MVQQLGQLPMGWLLTALIVFVVTTGFSIGRVRAERYMVAGGDALGFEQSAESIGVDVAALKLGPGIVVWIAGIDAANEVLRQAVVRLVSVEGVEGAGNDDAAEIPEDRLDRTGGHSASRSSRFNDAEFMQ